MNRVKLFKDEHTTWCVRIAGSGERRFPGKGGNESLESGGWTVQFYDTRYMHSDFGQFTSGSYYLTTLLERHDKLTHAPSSGLSLYGNSAAWTVSGVTMEAITEWLLEFEEWFRLSVYRFVTEINFDASEEDVTELMREWAHRQSKRNPGDQDSSPVRQLLNLGRSPFESACTVVYGTIEWAIAPRPINTVTAFYLTEAAATALGIKKIIPHIETPKSIRGDLPASLRRTFVFDFPDTDALNRADDTQARLADRGVRFMSRRLYERREIEWEMDNSFHVNYGKIL